MENRLAIHGKTYCNHLQTFSQFSELIRQWQDNEPIPSLQFIAVTPTFLDFEYLGQVFRLRLEYEIERFDADGRPFLTCYTRLPLEDSFRSDFLSVHELDDCGDHHSEPAWAKQLFCRVLVDTVTAAGHDS